MNRIACPPARNLCAPTALAITLVFAILPTVPSQAQPTDEQITKDPTSFSPNEKLCPHEGLKTVASLVPEVKRPGKPAVAHEVAGNDPPARQNLPMPPAPSLLPLPPPS